MISDRIKVDKKGLIIQMKQATVNRKVMKKTTTLYNENLSSDITWQAPIIAKAT